MRSKTLNKKQGIGLLFAGVGVLLGITSNYISVEYKYIILGISILLLVSGCFIVFKYSK